MKSILLSSNNSSSNNNYSTSVGSHHHTNTDVENNIIENIEKEQYNNKLLSHSNNIKKQVIRHKIIAKNDDKLKRVSNSAVGVDNNENHPLIESNLILNESDNNQKSATKLINLRKKNGTTLIFQRKNYSQSKQQCPQQPSASLVLASEYQELKKESLKKRRSLQWPYSVVSNNNTTNDTTTCNSNRFDNRNRHSYTSSLPWYDSRYPNSIEEEFENSQLTQFANEEDESNLAGITTIVASSSVLNIDDNVPDYNHQSTTTTMKTMKTSSMDNSSTTGTTTTSSKRWRIEQFLKNLVGKRSSSSTTTVQATITTNSNHSSSQSIVAIQQVSKSPSAYDLLPQKSINDGSTNSLNKDRLINKSTASLNSTSLAIVHQKLWSVVPLLNRKDGGSSGASCNNLLANLNGNVSHNSGKMRKCETVLGLTDDETFASTSSSTCHRNHYRINNNNNNSNNHSKSINNLLEPMPMRPLNRLRNSQSCYVNCEQVASTKNHQTCSRCSSLLSLAAIGDSNYSLTNGAFVLKNNKKQKVSTKRNSLLDDDLLTAAIVADQDDSSSNHNLIDNDFNSIEPYDTSSSNSIMKLPLVKAQQHTKVATIKFTCKLCLGEFFNEDKLTTIASCGCIFCTECMRAYVEFEISEGAYELSCPDALCNSQGVVSLDEISELATASLVAKHHRYRLNREVELDKYRLWCPNRNCETICSVIPISEKLSPSTSSSSAIQQPSSSAATLLLPRSVLCPTCNFEFCSSCKKAWHQSISCEENSKRLGSDNDSMMLFDTDLIKNCPMCAVPIEKDEGCAQMMCKRCKHVFCWYCLASLDDDFLLRHYDKGPCKNKLGHSRASVVWHRAQVIGIFAGFGILLLVASPLLLLAAPCIVCCKCKIEESTTVGNGNKLDEHDNLTGIGGGRDRANSDHQV